MYQQQDAMFYDAEVNMLQSFYAKYRNVANYYHTSTSNESNFLRTKFFSLRKITAYHSIIWAIYHCAIDY